MLWTFTQIVETVYFIKPKIELQRALVHVLHYRNRRNKKIL